VLLGGDPVLFVERGGRSLVPLRDVDAGWLDAALAALVAHFRDRGRGTGARLAVERFDGEPVLASPALDALVAAGFLAGPRRVTLRA
jgi:ATP-dependent Lhr-like helicase